ncbi:hypothetical protein D3C85_1163620 [compost metagenome]
MASFIFSSINFFENESETTRLISLTGIGSLKGLKSPVAASFIIESCGIIANPNWARTKFFKVSIELIS